MIYTARYPKVEATQAKILDGPNAGEVVFHVSGDGALTAVVSRDAFLSMYEAVASDVPAAEEPAPSKKAAKKVAVKKVKASPGQYSPAVKKERAGGEAVSINEAICQALEANGPLATGELPAAVEKIRPGSNPSSVFAAVSPCIHKNLIRRRPLDNKLEIIP